MINARSLQTFDMFWSQFFLVYWIDYLVSCIICNHFHWVARNQLESEKSFFSFSISILFCANFVIVGFHCYRCHFCRSSLMNIASQITCFCPLTVFFFNIYWVFVIFGASEISTGQSLNLTPWQPVQLIPSHIYGISGNVFNAELSGNIASLSS